MMICPANVSAMFSTPHTLVESNQFSTLKDEELYDFMEVKNCLLVTTRVPLVFEMCYWTDRSAGRDISKNRTVQILEVD